MKRKFLLALAISFFFFLFPSHENTYAAGCTVDNPSSVAEDTAFDINVTVTQPGFNPTSPSRSWSLRASEGSGSPFTVRSNQSFADFRVTNNDMFPGTYHFLVSETTSGISCQSTHTTVIGASSPGDDDDPTPNPDQLCFDRLAGTSTCINTCFNATPPREGSYNTLEECQADVSSNEPVELSISPTNPGFGTPISVTISNIPPSAATYSLALTATGGRLPFEIPAGASIERVTISSTGQCAASIDSSVRQAWTQAPACGSGPPFSANGTITIPSPSGSTESLQLTFTLFRGSDTIRTTTTSLARAVSTPTGPPPPCLEGEGVNGELVQNDPNAPASEQQKIVKCTKVYTAIGAIDTDPALFIKRIFGLLLGLAGGIALLLIIYAGYRLMTSQGDAEKIQGARETLTSAIVGLVFMVFSLVILQVIGVDILKIPNIGVTEIVGPSPTPEAAVPTGLPSQCNRQFSIENPDICGEDRARNFCQDLAQRIDELTPSEEAMHDTCVDNGLIQ